MQLETDYSEITKEEWSNWIDSIWDIGLNNKNIILHYRKDHPAISTPELIYRLVKLFSQHGDLILDPFAGTGTTLCVASLLNRRAIGVELSPKYYRLALENISLNHIASDRFNLFLGDARNVRHYVNTQVDCIITSPPYYNNIRYSDLSQDLSNFKNYDDYLANLQHVFSELKFLIKKGKKLVIIIGDSQKRKLYIPVHSDFIQLMNRIGFFQTHLIINRFSFNSKKRKTNKLFGFPNNFFPEFNHEFVLVFEK